MSLPPEVTSQNNAGATRMRSGSACSIDVARERHGSLDGGNRPISEDLTSVSQLEYAACQFDVRRVDDVIDDVADINDVNDEGKNVLHEMLEKYASLDRTERSRVKRQLLTVLSRFCDRGMDVSAPFRSHKGPTSSNYRYTGLHVLAKVSDCGDILRALMTSGADVNIAEGHGRSALHLAVEGASLDNVRALLEGGADVTRKDEYGQTALHYAVKGRHKPLEIIRTLLEHGADINSRDNTSRTPVHVAAKYSNVKVMEYLLSHGGHVNKMDDCGLSPVHYAALHDNSGKILKELLKYTSDINKRSAVAMETPLHAAVRHHMTENVITLCESGSADVNIGDVFGESPLHKAVKLEDWNLWQALLRSGGDAYKENSQGVTPVALLNRERNNLKSLVARYKIHGVENL